MLGLAPFERGNSFFLFFIFFSFLYLLKKQIFLFLVYFLYLSFFFHVLRWTNFKYQPRLFSFCFLFLFFLLLPPLFLLFFSFFLLVVKCEALLFVDNIYGCVLTYYSVGVFSQKKKEKKIQNKTTTKNFIFL